MLSNLTLTLCCLALGAPPSAEASQAGWHGLPVPSGQQRSDVAGGLAPPADWNAYPAGQYGAGFDYGAYCDHCGWHQRRFARPLCDFLCSPCDMTQRYPYYPKDHGHYYFRPYHMHRVDIHREIAAAWGEDPRNPYAHEVFERVYEQLRAEQPEELPPGSEPAPGTAPSVPAPPIPAPPVPTPPQPEPEEEAQGESPEDSRKGTALRPVSIGAVQR